MDRRWLPVRLFLSPKLGGSTAVLEALGMTLVSPKPKRNPEMKTSQNASERKIQWGGGGRECQPLFGFH